MDWALNSWRNLQRKIQDYGATSSAASSVDFAIDRPEQINDYVYEVHSPQGRPSVELVFFHGLQLEGSNEAYLRTWLSADGSQLWLNWILEDFPAARILLISYDAFTKRTEKEGNLDLFRTCENLVQDLTEGKAQVGQDGCPVILVGHCIGGLVMKELCVALYSTVGKLPHYNPDASPQNLFLNIKGLFFYGCPHHGSKLADKSTQFPKGSLFAEITTLNTEAQRRNQKFHKLRLITKWKTYGIAEGCVTNLGQFNDFIVLEASTRDDMDGFYTDVAADHFTLTRHKSQTSSSFHKLLDLINNVLKEDKERQGPNIEILEEIIGLERQVETIIQNLDKTPCLGIVGMGGIGKTTLAKVVHNKISGSFEYTCFLGDVKEVMAKKQDRKYFKQFIVDSMYYKGRQVEKSVFKWASLNGKKVLIILDDVDHESQLLTMAELVDFSTKSHVIVTSRDSGFLIQKKFKCNFVEELDFEHAQRLFCIHAFQTENAPSSFVDKVARITKKCGGLPLVIVVVGKYLFDEEDLVAWDDVLERLRLAEPLDGSKKDGLWSVIIMSYESLAEQEKQMFLDIATCFHDEDLEIVKQAWRLCGWASTADRLGLKNLLNKGLVTIGKTIRMHEVLRDLGRSIVCGSDPENVANHSRVCYDRSNQLPTTWPFSEGNSVVKILKIKAWYRTIQLQEVHGLKALKVLWLDRVSLNGPCKLLPPKVVYMRMSASNWKSSNRTQGSDSGVSEPGSRRSGQYPALRHLEIDDCQRLQGLQDSVGDLQVLEHLELYSQAWKALPETLGQLRGLKSLKIISCPNLKSISLPNIKYLALDNCSSMPLSDSLAQLQALQDLRILNSCLQAPSITIGQLKALRHFEISWCHDWRALLDILGQLQALKKLVIHSCIDHGCPRIVDLLEFLVSLARRGILQGSGQVDLPRPTLDEDAEITWYHDWEVLLDILGQQQALKTRLKRLVIHRCMNHDDCPSVMSQLQFQETLAKKGLLQGVGQVDLPAFHANSIQISAEDSEFLPSGFGQLGHASILIIKDCIRLKCLPDTLGQFQALQLLKVANCHHLEFLPDTIGELQALQNLWILHCNNVKTLPDTIGDLRALRHFTIESCESLQSLPDALGNIRVLERLEIRDCNNLKAVPSIWGELRLILPGRIRMIPGRSSRIGMSRDTGWQ